MTVIGFLSFTTLENVPLPSFSGWDKLGHFSMYFVMEFLLFIPLRKQKEKLLKWSSVILFYSGITELIQHYFIENRLGEWMDFIANSLGILFAYLVLKHKIKN